MFNLCFDPENAAHQQMIRRLPPQGRACVLAGLGCHSIPDAPIANVIPYPELANRLGQFPDLFNTNQPLVRIFGLYRPILIEAGVLTITGPGSKSRHATDNHVYSFSVPDPAVLDLVLPRMTPQAKSILKVILADRTGSPTIDIRGAELREVLRRGSERGEIETKMPTFRVFQLLY